MTLSNDPLAAEARELLAAADANPAVKAYRERLPLSSIWNWNESFKRDFIGEPSMEALAKLQTHLFVHNPQSKREMELAVEWNLQQKWNSCYTASQFAPEDSTVTNGKKRYWHDDFRHYATLARIARALEGTSLSRVVELGAGCGNLARMTRMQHPNVKYFIVDLHDTMIYSHMFLRAHFPDAKFLFVTDETKAVDLPGYDFVFVPCGLEHVLHGMEFDAFINTASMGEMPHKTCQHWFDFFQNKVSVKYAFSVNRFLNTVRDDEYQWRQNENGHWLLWDKNWQVLDWELQPDFLRCPYQNRHARQVLTFMKRLSMSPADADNQKYGPEAASLIEGAMTASWNHSSLTMTAMSPPIANDFTRSGPLYKLWSAVWLDPGKASARALLQYMRYLAPGQRFEDEAYLVRMVESAA